MQNVDFKKGLKFAIDCLIVKYKNSYANIFFDELNDISPSTINTYSIGLKLLTKIEPKSISVKFPSIDEEIKNKILRVSNQIEIPELYYTVISNWNELLRQLLYFTDYNLIGFIRKNYIYAKVLKVQKLKKGRKAEILFIKNDFDRRIITVVYDGFFKCDFYDYMFLSQELLSGAIIEYLEKDLYF